MVFSPGIYYYFTYMPVCVCVYKTSSSTAKSDCILANF